MASARPQDAICRIVEDRILELETKAPVVLNQDLAGHSTQAQTDVPTPFPTAEIMQNSTSWSTSSTTVGLIQAPTTNATTSLTSTTADFMQAPSINDTDRFMHILFLLVKVGSRVLRRLLHYHTVTPTCTLDQYLAKNRIDIDNLRKRKILQKYQMNILFPPGGSTNLGDYNITLLSALFTNIVSTISQQQLNMIHFLRDKKNEIFAHGKSVMVNLNDYQTFWNDICRVLVALSKQCGDPYFENEISREIQGIQVSTVQGTSLLDALQTPPRRMESHAHESDEDLVGSQLKKLHRTVLNRCLPNLMKDLDVRVVMKYIQQEELFNAVTIHDINEQTTKTDTILCLIDQIKKRDQHTYVRFKECLIRAQRTDLKIMLDEEEENLVAEMKEKHQGNPLEAVRPVDVLLAIISDKSIETILQMTTSLQESEIPDIEIRNVSTHLQHIHEKSLIEKRKEDIFKTLFYSCKSDLLNILETGEHSDDILRSALQYILPINDPSATAAILNVAGVNLKSKLSNPDCDVWGGLDVRIDSECRVSLVCVHRGNLNTQPDSHLGLRVLYREYDIIEREPFDASFSDEYHTSISPENLRRANILINKHGDELFKIHTNLVAVSPSSVLSSKSRGLKIEPSIVLYCRMKGVIPIGENHFPKTLELEGIILPTDIREGLFTFVMHERAQQKFFRPLDRNDKLRMGCSIGIENRLDSGTLGPFVRLGSDVGFITCAHFIGFDKRTVVDKTVVQPGNGDSNETERACGTVLDVHFDPDKPVDAALIKVNNRDVAPTDFTWFNPKQVLDAGFDLTKPPSFLGGSVRMDTDFSDAQGKRVIKFGKATGLTKGSLALNGIMIRIEDCRLHLPEWIIWNELSAVVMKNQYLVENNRYPFCSSGDSGAGVYLVENEQNNLSLIGIIIGLLNDYTIVTPIGPVLESLKLMPEDVIADDLVKVTAEIHKSSQSHCTLQ